MSIECLNWAFNRKIKPSALKFVLVALSDFASENGEAFPTVETLSNKTGQDRKTVIKNLGLLVSSNIIIDTGHRRGSKNQTKVYKIDIHADIPSYKEEGAETVKVTSKPKSPKNGTQFKEYRFWKLRVPFLDVTSTKNGTLEESQKRYTEPPLNNHQEPPIETITPRQAEESDKNVELENLHFKVETNFKKEWINHPKLKDILAAVLVEYDLQPSGKIRKFISGSFLEHWVNGSKAKKYKKLDWAATWENRVRDQVDRNAYRWRLEQKNYSTISDTTQNGSAPSTGIKKSFAERASAIAENAMRNAQ